MLPAPRKPKKAIQDAQEIERILDRGQVLYLAMSKDDQPYVLPFNYGRQGGRIYLHTGRQGFKHQFLAANPRVSFAVAVDVELVPGQEACAWDCRYQSVVGVGRARVVEDPAERELGLRAVTAHYAGPGEQHFRPASLERACVVCVEIDALTGKRNQT